MDLSKCRDYSAFETQLFYQALPEDGEEVKEFHYFCPLLWKQMNNIRHKTFHAPQTPYQELLAQQCGFEWRNNYLRFQNENHDRAHCKNFPEMEVVGFRQANGVLRYTKGDVSPPLVVDDDVLDDILMYSFEHQSDEPEVLVPDSQPNSPDI